MVALLISTYDLGHQPFGLASPAAWLRDAGVAVGCADLARERLSEDAVRSADVVAFFLPMHTATRLALPVIDKVRQVNPSARLVAYGLYAPLNADILRSRGVQEILGGEFEQALVEAVTRGAHQGPRAGEEGVPAASEIPRLAFRVPDRQGLPALTQYATLCRGGERRTAGYTEASRGCKHFCRHCPIVPVYNGRFRIVPPAVVLDDVRAQVAAGARHITFGDPDFFNGIRHAATVIERFGREFPGVSYDVTIKVEHLLKHAEMLPRLRDTGCAFVTSAVESLDDDVLARLEKGHSRADFERVVALFGQTGLTLSPTFVPFTPWTTLESYCDLLHTIDRLSLVEHVSPVQLTIRLLIPEGSRLLELDDVRAVAEGFDSRSLTYRWRHPDPRVDVLQAELTSAAGVTAKGPRAAVFARIWEMAHQAAGAAPPVRTRPAIVRATVPYLDEPWYC